MKFDELNQLKRFFSTMDISEEEKRKRCDLAFLFYDAVWYTFTITRAENNIAKIKDESFSIDIDSFKATLKNRMEDALVKENVPYEPEYISQLVNDITDTTLRHPDDLYYLSKDRALIIAQNEANSVYNFADFERARRDGKKYKTWLTENDERVRLEHTEVDGIKIPIDDKFAVGSDLMDYPHDYLNGSPGNLINCRCICVYE